MKRYLFLSIAIIFLAFSVEIKAQETVPTVTPTPILTPTPLPTETPVSVPTPTPAPTPVVDDKQQVQPENLQGVPTIAPNYRNNDLSLPDLGRVGVDMMDQRALTLREAIALALENNKDIEVTRQNVRIAEFDLSGAKGVYEPKFTGQTYYERSKQPVFSFFGGGPDGSVTTSGLVANAGLQGGLEKYGSNYNVTFSNSRTTTNSLFSLVNPTFTNTLTANFTQPLLRGRRFDQNRRTIEIDKRNLSLTDTQFRQKSIEIISNVQRAYWDLAYAYRNLQVQRDSVRDAKDQLDHNQRLVNEGQLAPIDVVAAETQVANFEQAVYDALNTVTISENSLKNLVSPNRADPIWNQSVTPVDPVDLDVPATTLPEALDAALQNRPELEINQTQKDINEIDRRFFREQDKPQVDLIASYSLTGAAGNISTGTVNPFTTTNTTPTLNRIIGNLNTVTAQNYPALPQITPIPIAATQSLPSNLTNGFGGAFSNLLALRYPTYRVGVQFNLPLFGNKTVKAQLGRNLVESERLQTQREQIEQNIQVDVRNTLQTVRTAESRLRVASIARANSEKLYSSEQRKLDAGQSDVYKVLDRQTALASAKSSELRAQTELNKAIADLQRATGNSLKANNVEAKLRR